MPQSYHAFSVDTTPLDWAKFFSLFGVPLSPLARHRRRANKEPLPSSLGKDVLAGVACQRPAGSLDEDPTPLFSLRLFNGGELSLEDLSGQVVVIKFWASWCPSCREEAPTLGRTWRAYKERGGTFVGINYMDTEPAAQGYHGRIRPIYPSVLR